MNLKDFTIKYLYGQGLNILYFGGLNFELKKNEIIKTVKEIDKKNLFGEELHNIINSVSEEKIQYIKN